MAARCEQSVRTDAQVATRFVTWFRRLFKGN